MRAVKLVSYVLIASLLALIPLAQAKLDPANLKRGIDSIRPQEAYVLNKILASPEFAGRLRPGRPLKQGEEKELGG
jgi:hypothetical protein